MASAPPQDGKAQNSTSDLRKQALQLSLELEEANAFVKEVEDLQNSIKELDARKEGLEQALFGLLERNVKAASESELNTQKEILIHDLDLVKRLRDELSKNKSPA